MKIRGEATDDSTPTKNNETYLASGLVSSPADLGRKLPRLKTMVQSPSFELVYTVYSVKYEGSEAQMHKSKVNNNNIM
jgi:hypothetical protein